jgi:hypothetical protein
MKVRLNRDNSVGKVIGYLPNIVEVQASISGTGRDIFLHRQVRTNSLALTALFDGHRGLFPVGYNGWSLKLTT